MKKFLLVLTLVLCTISAFAQLPYSAHFPRWIKNGSLHSDQTSGITFLRTTTAGKEFLLADDTGFLRRLIISQDTLFIIRDLVLAPGVAAYFDRFPKKDFEEIVYDRGTGDVLLSIEGNDPGFIKWVGVYKLTFAQNSPFNDTVVAVSKLVFTPQDTFLKYTASNIGFEGFAADENYFYAGLEGFQSGKDFADSTYLYVIDKHTNAIKKIISTKGLGIQTICGLCAVSNGKLLVMDRNQAKLFYITIGDSLDAHVLANMTTPPAIPQYTQFPYTQALESVTFDDEGNIYLVDDPWKSHFIPSAKIFDQLDKSTQNSFKEFIPVIYKLTFQTLMNGK